MKPSRSPSQKLVCSACDFDVSSVEISAPNSPANSFGNSSLSTLAFGARMLHRADEVAPGILAPGVVLVDAGIARDVLLLRDEVARRAGVIHRGVRRRTEDVFARLFLEDARRAAVEIDRQRLELLGDRRDRKAASRGDVADHRVDLVALHQIAELGDDLGGGARLVDVLGLDLGAAEPDRVVRARAPCRH